MASGSVEKLSGRVLHGPNRWSRLPMVHLTVDLGELDATSTERLPGFPERLMAALPGLIEHGCSEGRRGGFESRLHEGTWLGHVIEHVALEVQRAVGATDHPRQDPRCRATGRVRRGLRLRGRGRRSRRR